ncbi:MAG: PAS domain-containing protein [Bacteroidales bacterium]|nr:PAS domain-containing protein [Bacteroidales bacterium]
MALEDDDIIEYSQSIDRLQRENSALKRMLRRYTLFGENDPLDNLYDCDITAQMRELENMTTTLFNTLLVPAFAGELITDDRGIPTDFMYTRANTRFADFFHLEPNDIIGKTNSALSLLKSNLWLDTIAITSKTLDVKEIQIAEGDDLINVNIASFTHSSFISHFYVSHGKIMDNAQQNIDLSQTMDSRLIMARRELSESENRYKSLFNGISQPIIIVDEEGNIILLNTSAVELFEEDEKNLMTSDRQEVPAQKLIDMEYVRQVFKTGEPISRRVQLQINGQDRWYQCRLQLVNDLFGEKVVQIISNDITELKHYQAELIEEKQRAEESNNLKTIFLSNIAHETRTPANMICGLAQMMQQGIGKEKHPEYLAQIYSNCKKLLDIIDDIVELSKIESGQIKIRHEICSINNIVEEAFASLTDAIADTGKPIKALRSQPIDEYQSLIYTDNQYVSQVCRKLVSNAVTFTQKGEIEIGAQIDGGKIRFYVRDTGIGIPQNRLSTIFERFRQGDEGARRQYGGNGLGLAISNELVCCMGGSMHVESEEGKGSTFSFTIPYNRAGV